MWPSEKEQFLRLKVHVPAYRFAVSKNRGSSSSPSRTLAL